jgi:hypothetical protein
MTSTYVAHEIESATAAPERATGRLWKSLVQMERVAPVQLRMASMQPDLCSIVRQQLVFGMT